MIKVGLALFSLASILNLVARGIDQSYPNFLKVPFTSSNIILISVCIGVVGVFIFSYGCLHYGLARILVPKISDFLDSKISYIGVRAKSDSDLKWIFDYASGKFQGQNVSSLTQMESWHRKNNNLFWIITKEDKNKQSVSTFKCGYFCVIPVTKRATKHLDANNLDGSRLRVEDISSRTKQAFGAYIGAIVADNNKAKAYALYAIRNLVNDDRFNGISKIYAKAASDDGLRLLTKNGFQPVIASDKAVIGTLFSRNR